MARLYAYTAPPASTCRKLVGALAAAGVPMFRVEPDEPSLEDVYFALEHE